jgi:nucleotide-binding universal stress UspA family protein
MSAAYQRILVTTDGSTLSNRAVRSAIDLAAAVGAELVAMHVVPHYPINYFEGALTLSPSEIARTEKAWVEKAEEILSRVVSQASAKGVKARPVVAKSDEVARAILAAAKKNRCDLIVMASHGRRGLQRVLLGSETQHVLTHGTTPVLVLR